MCSPRINAARKMVSARLSLSIGATREAGASWRARKYAIQESPVPMPDNVKNNNGRPRTLASCCCSPNPIARPQANTTTTVVRTAVARFEGIPSTPIFARIAVNAAKNAESRA
jgi:hypothetical protein